MSEILMLVAYEIVQITKRLKELNVPVADNFIVHRVLDSLSMEFEPLKIYFNTYRDKWNIDNLILFVFIKKSK